MITDEKRERVVAAIRAEIERLMATTERKEQPTTNAAIEDRKTRTERHPHARPIAEAKLPS